MKNLTLLVWLTQLGLSVAVPPVCLIMLSVWLRDSRGWGGWVIWAGVLLGGALAVSGLRNSLRTLFRLTRDKEKKEPLPVSFNDHD